MKKDIFISTVDVPATKENSTCVTLYLRNVIDATKKMMEDNQDEFSESDMETFRFVSRIYYYHLMECFCKCENYCTIPPKKVNQVYER